MSEVTRVMDTESFGITPQKKQGMIGKIKAEVNYDLIKKNQYDKFGDGEYISVETVVDILNETFDYTWSWEIISFIDKNDFVVCHGRLTVPGFGVRDGIGQAKADKKDNSTMYSSASSFAFKSAAKRLGIAANIFNKEGIGFPVFEPGTVQGATSPSVAQQQAAPAVEKPQVQTKKVIPGTSEEKAKELKEAYGLSTKGQFVAFAQIWNPNITDFAQITADVIDDLHKYAEENSVEFEDFNASNY